MKIDRLQLVKLRNSFYKDGFRRMSLMLLLSLIINFILIITLLVSHERVQRPIYFAASMDGTLKRLSPVQDAVYNDTQLQTWISRVVPQLLHLNFLDYKDQLLANRQYFTADGWANFNKAFAPQIQQITSQRLLTSAIIPNTPAVTAKLLWNGVYSWYVDVPVQVTFEGQDRSSTVNQYVWHVLVQRVDNRTSSQMLGIRQVVVQNMGK